MKSYYLLMDYQETGQAKVCVTARTPKEALEKVAVGDYDDISDTDVAKTELIDLVEVLDVAEIDL